VAIHWDIKGELKSMDFGFFTQFAKVVWTASEVEVLPPGVGVGGLLTNAVL
jgi:hypothetical protein